MVQLTPEFIGKLQAIWGKDAVSTGASVLDLHAGDESFHPRHPPDVVVFAQETAGVSSLLQLANQEKVPVTPWGAGTSLEGNPTPVRGGIVLDMGRMDRVLKVWPQDLQVRVQPGLVFTGLNKQLQKHGLFFPPDPGAPASIGGMIANNAGGVHALKYGVTRDCVKGLEVVLADGRILHTGTRAPKTSSGLALTHLFVGAEGTLGVVTEATLKLAGIPREISAVIATFSSVEGACTAASQIVQSGVGPAALEFLDGPVVALINRYKDLSLKPEPTLFMAFHGNSKASLREDLGFVEEVCGWNGVLDFNAGVGPEARDRLWEARHHARYAIHDTLDGRASIVLDVAVPVSAFAQIVGYTKSVLVDLELEGYPFGHAGDGNLHVEILADRHDAAEWAKVERANERIVERALDLDGTATGEHGVGVGKRQFMAREHGLSLEVMRQLKHTLDPNGILNPGKKF